MTRTRTKASKLKQAESMRLVWANQEFHQRMVEKQKQVWRKGNPIYSQKTKANWKKPEYRKKVKEGYDSVRKDIFKSGTPSKYMIRKYGKQFGVSLPKPPTKKQLSIKTKQLWKDPNYVKKCKEGCEKALKEKLMAGNLSEYMQIKYADTLKHLNN